MRLASCCRNYAKYQCEFYHHTFARPSADRAWCRLLKFISDAGEYCANREIERNYRNGGPSHMNLFMLEFRGFVENYREGRYTYWKLTAKGRDVVTKIFNAENL